MSRPTWACGLKHISYAVLLNVGVTPHVGVWIETWMSRVLTIRVMVTPHVGVWIETILLEKINNVAVSRPTWACGLKLKRLNIFAVHIRSRPTWACGLKPMPGVRLRREQWVTPHVGVWIETPNSKRARMKG